MIYKKILEKPFRLMPVIGIIYLIITLILTLVTGFAYEESVMPYAKLVAYSSQALAFILCILSFIFYKKHFIYYSSLEVLILSNLYTGRIYTALFMSSILFVLILFEKRTTSKIRMSFYFLAEVVKLVLVIPYGLKSLIEYIGIMLFSLCTIGCLNLLFRHAYSKDNSLPVSLDDYKFTERQKDCIRETVLNNTTIKALAINHKVSESAIKKDLSHIYSVLGISGKADLKALFLGSNLEKETIN